ncbi:MAG TPA: GGDEF domain-containing protein [Polyangiaceae bacterium]|nr:GGDEF domain-containing protein [Polyangiaceae bacterium]
MSDFDEKTRVTQVVQGKVDDELAETGNDCLVVIYTKEPNLLGKRFVLDGPRIRVGRGADNAIVLEGDSVSRQHAHFERRGTHWHVVDDGSTNGTYVNEKQIVREAALRSNDRVKVGPTILKYLSGADAEAKYHEEIYRMTIVDGLTQIHNKRYLFESLEREIIRSRRHDRPLSLLMFDIDFFKRINDHFGHLAGDYVLRELAETVQSRIRRDEVFARYGGEEFVIVLPETTMDGAQNLAETVREKVADHPFVFQGEKIPVTISIGCALVHENDSAVELIQRADEKLYEAKRSGRNRVCA